MCYADNEIQLKGATLMRGYFNRPEETAQSFTDDGWFKTGDAGMLDAQGHLFVTERIKDLMKTSGGKYIAPQKIEGLLVQDGLIDQAAVIADKRQYVSALIVPNYVELKLYAEKQGINSPSIEQLLKNEQIQTLIMQRVQQCQQGLASYEQVKRVALLAVPFSFDNAQLTPTLKLRRKNITRDYQTKIDELYCD
jgi:long-chain acyl-CoA synthetase